MVLVAKPSDHGKAVNSTFPMIKCLQKNDRGWKPKLVYNFETKPPMEKLRPDSCSESKTASSTVGFKQIDEVSG